MKNCDGFRPIARTKVGRFGNMGGNAGIPLVPDWDEGFLYFKASVCLRTFSAKAWVAPRNSRPNDGVDLFFAM